MRITRYKKSLDYSYTLGIYPTIDLLKYKAKQILKVIVSEKLHRQKGYQSIINLVKKHNITLEGNNKLIDKLSTKENCYAVGIFKKYKSKLGGGNHLLLVGPRNSGNLGTITRTMLSFGHADLAIVKPAVDIFHPQVVRSSMGAVFNVNFEYFDNIQEYVSRFSRNMYLFMVDGERELRKMEFDHPFTLVFGNESKGLPEEFRKLGTTIKLTQTDKVDSLNLAVVCGIVLYKSHSVA